MPVNYQQIQSQIVDYAAKAKKWQSDIDAIRQQGINLLNLSAESQEMLAEKVMAAVKSNSNLRCALPTPEKVNAVFTLPDERIPVTMLAADGSQVIPSRHRQVEFGVINISTVSMRTGSGQAPKITVNSEMLDLDLLLLAIRGHVGDPVLLRDERSLDLHFLAFQEDPPGGFRPDPQDRKSVV
jgi:hypothetical protein